MIKPLSALTTVCAAFAAWALGVFVLSLFGLGAGFSLHKNDPNLAPPLPRAETSINAAALGPATDYLEIGQRPLLSPDRKPGQWAGNGEDDGSAPLEASLTSVLIAGKLRLAILQNNGDGKSRRVREGEVLEGSAWRLQSVEPRRAVFIGPTGEKVLDLRVYDGKAGPPVPAADAAAVNTNDAPKPETKPDAVAEPAATTESADQQAQVEAIRRRIEARRAEMRAEAQRNAAQETDK